VHRILQLYVAGGDEHVDHLDAGVDGGVDVALDDPRQPPQTVVFVAAAMSLTASNSASEFTGNPASMTWVFMSSSVAAMRRFSS